MEVKIMKFDLVHFAEHIIPVCLCGYKSRLLLQMQSNDAIVQYWIVSPSTRGCFRGLCRVQIKSTAAWSPSYCSRLK